MEGTAQMAWKCLTKTKDFATFLGVSPDQLATARRQSRNLYIEEDRRIGKKGKVRHLCYPRRDSQLRRVQAAIKQKCLADLELTSAVCGYRRGQHNINCAQRITGCPFVAMIDIRDFHPSITPELITKALRYHGVSWPISRIITQLVTFNNCVPQGAHTSNHIANVVMAYVLAQGILRKCECHQVSVVNFGDDTAFAGADRDAVDACAAFAKAVFEKHGMATNDKSSSAEHIGAARCFIGTCTGRRRADLPRRRFREYRRELRTALQQERMSAASSLITERDVRSFRAKIAYVRRMNRDKARVLSELFYRLCSAKRNRILRTAQ